MGINSVVKPEWGTKRTCQSCAARFYDLQRKPIVCPKCETVFEPPPPAKTRRVRPAPAPKAAPVAPVLEVPAVTPVKADEDIAAVETIAIDDTKADASTDDEEKKDDPIEDASELGEDEDDMAEVLEGAVTKDDAGSA